MHDVLALRVIERYRSDARISLGHGSGNETLVASYPKITVTISNPDGTVIATDSQMAFLHVMPEDTATIIGSMSVPLGRITNETMVSIHPSWDSFTSVNLKQVPRTTDFEIGNVTEQPGSQSFVTGTITNLTESLVTELKKIHT